jgi:hypothetical protein
MNRPEIEKLLNDLKKILKSIEEVKEHEKHLEKKRLLKMIDAELMDALHNLEKLREME